MRDERLRGVLHKYVENLKAAAVRAANFASESSTMTPTKIAISAQLGVIGVFFYWGVRQFDRINWMFGVSFLVVSAIAWTVPYLDDYFDDHYGRDRATQYTLTVVIILSVIGLGSMIAAYFYMPAL